MPEVIRQLPENVSNQIAAGEVVQRPASAVKELMENAVDAGASRIEVRVVDAGRTLIQVLDNGAGMVLADAERCFQRHATSKISVAEDLYSIVSKGFRGEALASIASIAHVELKTRHASEEHGVQLLMEGGKASKPMPCALELGTQIAVKHLFFNVPARRNFLKSDAVEMRHVIDEFHRLALAHEGIHFSLHHNDSELFNLKISTRRKRVVGVFGSKYDERLVPVEETTDVVGVEGFVGKPEFARRTRGEQFLFVNQRFIKHPLLHRTIMDAYEGLLPRDQYPLYVLFLTIDPARLDVNIHPTKTEIKFDEERHVLSLLLPAIRRGLGKYAVAPSLDFDQETGLNITPLDPTRNVPEPAVTVNADYNPFRSSEPGATPSAVTGTRPSTSLRPGRGQMDAWKKLYGDALASEPIEVRDGQTDMELVSSDVGDAATALLNEQALDQKRSVFQFQQRYVATSTRSGILLIDQHRAHQRVLYELLVSQLENATSSIPVQRLLFPELVELNASDRHFVLDSKEWLERMGLHLEPHDNGVEITGMPAEGGATPTLLIEAVLEDDGNELPGISRAERVAAQMAQTMAIRAEKPLKEEEMTDLLGRLFGCSTPDRDPFGRRVIVNFDANDIEQRFQ